MKTRRLSLGVILVLVELVVIALSIGVYQYLAHTYRSDFVPGPDYQDKTVLSVKRSQLEGWGLDLTVPAVPEGGLTFTSPRSVDLYSVVTMNHAGIEQTIGWGAEVTCDFVAWSGTYGRGYEVRIVSGGRTWNTLVQRADLARMYQAALEQNGLESEFEAATGRRLSLKNAAWALARVNQQLYERGIYIPSGYPYDLSHVLTGLLLGDLALPVVMILLSFLVLVFFPTQVQDRVFNRENTADWNRKAGTLPQFTSLRQSGIRGPNTHRVTFLEALSLMFKPRTKS